MLQENCDNLLPLLQQIPACEKVNEKDVQEWMEKDEQQELTDNCIIALVNHYDNEGDEDHETATELGLDKTEYKNHPLYVLRKDLLKFEAIYPPDAPTLGFIRGQEVFARECVKNLHSRETWVKEAKVVRLGEKPYKIVKARPKYDRMTGTVIKDLPLEVFGEWQVEDYIPPPAVDGKVPRNAYGNVELFKPCMLPKGTVHLQSSSSISSYPSSSLDSCCSLIISASSRVPQTVISSSAAMYSSYVQSGANLRHVSSSHGRVKVRGANKGAVDGPGRGFMQGPTCGYVEGPGWELAYTGGGLFGSSALAAVGSTWTAASLSTGKTKWAFNGLNRVAKKLNIDCAPAVVGFDFHCGGSHPTYDGFVVCEEFVDILLDAWNQEMEEGEKRRQDKHDKRVYGNWRRLIKGLLIRERLQARYSFERPEDSSKGKLKVKKRKLKSESESD
uniref:Uncharacterized protein n=1 Tax=Timema douglasi TaxID=61478 RepID=A0A7R8VL19_TIMDO|nr:unnamed protein product [Timema douglasi]